MNTEKYEKRIAELNKIIKSLEPRILKFPGGNLRISKDGKCKKYYLITEKGDTNGKYIKKNDELVQKIATRDYYIKLVKESKREKRAIERFLYGMKGTRPEDVFSRMSVSRQELVCPILVSDEEYVKQWIEEKYEGNPYDPEQRVYDTKQGEKVRSKSEAMIADIYYELHIPYRYEYPLKLHDGRVKYPDFQLLKMPERKEIYHEHMGLFEDEYYRKMNLLKLNEYNKSGLCCCDNLIVTFETEYAPLNIKDIRNMIINVFQ